MNAVSISGNLGRDAVIKSTSNGTNVTRFSVACNRKGTDGKEYTDWKIIRNTLKIVFFLNYLLIEQGEPWKHLLKS